MQWRPRAFPTSPNFARARFLPQGFCALAAAFRAGAAHPGGYLCSNRRRSLRGLPRPALRRRPLAADVFQPLRRPGRQGVPVAAPARPGRPHVAGERQPLHGRARAPGGVPARAQARRAVPLRPGRSLPSALARTRRPGCSSREKRVFQGLKRQNKQSLPSKQERRARALDSQIEEAASARSPTSAASGKRGCGPGGNPGFGCRSGARSRTEPGCFAPPEVLFGAGKAD